MPKVNPQVRQVATICRQIFDSSNINPKLGSQGRAKIPCIQGDAKGFKISARDLQNIFGSDPDLQNMYGRTLICKIYTLYI